MPWYCKCPRKKFDCYPLPSAIKSYYKVTRVQTEQAAVVRSSSSVPLPGVFPWRSWSAACCASPGSSFPWIWALPCFGIANNPISPQIVQFLRMGLKNHYRASLLVSKANKPVLLPTVLFLSLFAWEKGGGCGWSNPTCSSQNISILTVAEALIPLMEVSGKWIFVVKLSRVLFLTLLLNCFILKLK